MATVALPRFVIAGLVPATQEHERQQGLAPTEQPIFQPLEIMGRRDEPGGDDGLVWPRSGGV